MEQCYNLSRNQNARLRGSECKTGACVATAESRFQQQMEKDLAKPKTTMVRPNDVARALRTYAAAARRIEEYQDNIRCHVRMGLPHTEKMELAKKKLEQRLSNLDRALDVLEDTQRRLVYLIYIDGIQSRDKDIRADWSISETECPENWRQEVQTGLSVMAYFLNKNRLEI